MSKETDIDCLLKSIDYNLTDWARAEFHKWLRKKDKKIADLEAKLAESEEQRKHLKDWLDDEILTSVDHESYYATINEYEEEVKKLKQQLAESEKKKEDFKTMYFNKCLDYEHLHEKFDDKCAEFELKEYDYKQTIFEKDQDKISFAVEKLKETQIYVDNQHFMNARYKCEKKVYADIWNFIDNQIKQLKEIKNV